MPRKQRFTTLSGKYVSPWYRHKRLLANLMLVKFIRARAHSLVQTIDHLPKKPGPRTGAPVLSTTVNNKTRLPEQLDDLWLELNELGHLIRHLLENQASRQRIGKKSSAG